MGSWKDAAWRKGSWSRLPLSFKILIPINGLGLLALLAVALLTYAVARDAVRQEIIVSGQRIVSSFAQSNALEFLDDVRGKHNLKLRLHKIIRGDEEGRIVAAAVFDREKKMLAAEGDESRLGAQAVLSQNDLVVTEGTRGITMTKPVVYDDVVLGQVVFEFDHSAIARAGQRIFYFALLIAGFFVILSGVVTFFLLRWLMRPVVSLGRAAQRFAGGDYGQRINVGERSDEVGMAAGSFNAMCDAIELHMRFSNEALINRIRQGKALEEAREHHLAIAFGDAVGYTRWSQKQPPAKVFEILTRYYTCVGLLIVKKFGGIVDKFMGDGIMAHFGLLQQHEDVVVDWDKDPAGAAKAFDFSFVRDGLSALIYSQVVLRVLAHAILMCEDQEPLGYRFGLASGRCLVGALGAKDVMLDYSLIGGVVNLASRLEQRARSGGLVVDRFTCLDIEPGFIDAREAGEHEVKGIKQPVQIYAVRGFQDKPPIKAMQEYLLDDFFHDERVLDALVRSNDDEARIRMMVEHEIRNNPHLPV